MIKLLQELLVTAGLLMGAPETAKFGPPPVEITTHCALEGLLENGFFIEGLACNTEPTGVQAIYTQGTIFFGDWLDLETIYGRAVMIHEMGHYIQDLQGRLGNWTQITQCDKAGLEFEAYELAVAYTMQAEELDRAGALAVLDLREIDLYMMSHCDPISGRRN